MDNKREIWVDWLRVSACFLVMLVHSTEPFYLGGDGSLILSRTDMFWASFFDSFARACVPLFVVASSYLQFPLHYSTGEFFRRRAVRILVPFFIWTCVYAVIWGEPVQNFKDVVLNFNYAAGHLWFVYMLIGVYVLMPLLSPWAEKVEKRELLFFLGACFAASFIPFVRDYASSGNTPFTYGPSGIPMPALFPLWGEASWNQFGVFYYLSGFVGYLLLGLYLRKFAGDWTVRKTLCIALPCWLAGFAITFGGFVRRVLSGCGGVFPVEGDVSLAAWWETTWTFCSTGVALMAFGWLLLFRLCKSSGRFYQRIVLPVSKAGYGMYLCHMVALSLFSAFYRNAFGLGADGSLGVFTTPVQIILTAVSSYICVALFSVLVQRIPKIGKWIIG